MLGAWGGQGRQAQSSEADKASGEKPGFTLFLAGSAAWQARSQDPESSWRRQPALLRPNEP